MHILYDATAIDGLVWLMKYSRQHFMNPTFPATSYSLNIKYFLFNL